MEFSVVRMCNSDLEVTILDFIQIDFKWTKYFKTSPLEAFSMSSVNSERNPNKF